MVWFGVAHKCRRCALVQTDGFRLRIAIIDIVEFHESNKLIRDSQHGFRRGSSCLTILLLFLDKILQSVDEGFCVDVLFLDLAKAFDKVPHQRLLEKLRKHGISGKIIKNDWKLVKKQKAEGLFKW